MAYTRFKLLAHFGDCIIKHASSIVSSLTDQFHLPGTSRQPQVSRSQLNHLTRDLGEYWSRLPAARIVMRVAMSKSDSSVMWDTDMVAYLELVILFTVI